MIEIRDERPDDVAAIREVHDRAFGQQAESRLVDALREQELTSLSLVAVSEEDGAPRVVGHILCSPVALEGAECRLHGIAPLAVLPELQRQGIGSRLMHAALERARQASWDGVVLVGHPEYYPRFGFGRADALGLTCEFGCPPECFMALELAAGALAPLSGTVRYAAPFSAFE